MTLPERNLSLLTMAAIAIVSAAPLLGADEPKFEAASVKPSPQCKIHNTIDPAMIILSGDPLSVVVMEAFGVKEDQITGPSWLESECFDIAAKMPEGATKDQLPAMLRALLIERFKLVVHKENRLTQGYSLVVDKKGLKIHKTDMDSPYAKSHFGQVAFGGSGSPGIKGSITMARLAHFVSLALEVPVQNLTGLDGKYDVDVAWAPDSAFDSAAGGPTEPSLFGATGDIFSSFQKSLGLRLERSKQAEERVVIDHIERVPTVN